MANGNLNQMIAQSLFRINPTLRDNVLNQQLADVLASSGKSPQWQQSQMLMAQEAANAGLPSFSPTQTDSPARLRLMDAIARSEDLGFTVPHFIGTPYEPTGDRGVTMDVENLVKSLQAQQAEALKNDDKKLFDKISKERSFWEKEASEGMSAKEWKDQTGENDPIYPTLGQ